MSFCTIVIVLGIVSSLLWWLVVPRLLKRRGVEIRRTMFGWTLIFDSYDADKTPIRLLNVGGVYQSVAYTDQHLSCELACMYHQAFARVIGNAKRILVLGGGGFSFPKYLLAHHPEAQVDVVEIDPAIIEIAREKFDLARVEKEAGEHLSIICADALAWLKDSGETYDIIVNDAFSGKRPLGPMSTTDGALLIKEHLCADGIYMANVRSSLEGRRSENLAEVREAFGALFAHTYLVPDRPDKPGELGYNAFFASDKDLPELAEHAL